MDQWLGDVCGHYQYQHGERVRGDIRALLSRYNTLRPKVNEFTHHNGQTARLLCLYGTIPIVFRSTVYNIPVNLWLPTYYPAGPPFAYVVPQQEMVIKAGPNVTPEGLVTIGYLNQWQPHSGNLVNMVDVMCAAFGKEPPLYKKPAARTSNSSQHNAPYRPPPPTNMGASGQPQRPMPPLNAGGYGSTYGTGSAVGGVAEMDDYMHKTDSAETLEEVKRESVKSLALDKMRRFIKQYNQHAKRELDDLFGTMGLLKNSRGEIDRLLQEMANEKSQLEFSISSLQGNITKLKQTVEDTKDKAAVDISVDDLIVAPYPLYQQMLDLTAEDHAIQDAIYYLSRALNHGNIELPVYLKQVRNLARRQFMKRALLKKCRQQAGLKDNLVGAPTAHEPIYEAIH